MPTGKAHAVSVKQRTNNNTTTKTAQLVLIVYWLPALLIFEEVGSLSPKFESEIDNNSGMQILQSSGTMGVTALDLRCPGDGPFSEPRTKEPDKILSTDLFISWCIARHVSFIACFKVNM